MAATADVGSDELTDQAPPEPPTEPPTPDITYDEQFYPARPQSLRPAVRRPRARIPLTDEERGTPTADNGVYIAWLRENSMLHDANQLATQLSGRGSMWQHPFARPNAAAAIERGSVWFTAYPTSMITRPGQSFLAALGDEELWDAFAAIGVEGVHTGPVKVAGGLRGWGVTPSVDGHFDRVSMQIDPAFGTEEEYRALCVTANGHGGLVIDDIVPGHTGKGGDFRLAEMGFEDYPGIYHMVEIEPEDWHVLPEVPPGRDAANLSPQDEKTLAAAGYIIGELQRVIFYEPGIKETNWSATRPVTGVDGVVRRWVYLHYFKEGQPSINWLDPSFAGMRLVIGDACHALADLGAGALRLDANGFLGVEKSAEGLPAWSEGHPLSEAANQFIASIVRKMGGFTFQELNLALDDIRAMGRSGADLSYDFVNRPAYHHALVAHDTEFLRLTMNTALQMGISTGSLVHALQNHDELTHELVHFSTRHRDEIFTFRGEEVAGVDMAATVRAELCDNLTGEQAPYNLRFTTNGIACTTASVITAVLGLSSLDELGPEDVEQIRRVHLLLAAYNAMQPGVFALSGWDLCGMLTVDHSLVEPLIREGDTRWINRGAHDLMGDSPATRSERGMPRARSLYGSLPTQLQDPDSFASRLARLLTLRRVHGIATARQVDVPMVSHKSLLVMVHEVDAGSTWQITVLNFGADPVLASVRSDVLPPGGLVVDMEDDLENGVVNDLNTFDAGVGPYSGRFLVVRAPAIT